LSAFLLRAATMALLLVAGSAWMMPRMFYAPFSLCAVLPLFRLVAELRGIKEPDPWKVAVRVLQWAR